MLKVHRRQKLIEILWPIKQCHENIDTKHLIWMITSDQNYFILIVLFEFYNKITTETTTQQFIIFKINLFLIKILNLIYVLF